MGAGDASQLAERLMPGDDKMQPFWNEASQHLTAAVIQSFQEHSPGVWTLRDVLLALRWPERIKAIVERTPELAYVYFRYSADERLLSNLFATLSAKLRPFEQVAAAWHRSETSFRLDDWKDQVLVLGDHRPHSAAITPINQLILSLLTDRLLSEPDSDKRRSWVVLDEARELGRFTKLHSLLNQGRSKGCCVAIGFQDIDGMIDVYGRDVTNEMIGQCANKSFLRAGGPSSAKWVEDHFGQVHQRVHQTVVSQSYSTGQHGSSSRSYNHSQTERFQPVVLASEVAGLPKPAVDGHLCGYHDIAGLACYRSHQPFNDVLAALKPPADVASFEPRRREDQILPDWNADDLARLGLKSDPTPTIRPVAPPSLFNLAINEH